MTAVDAFTQVDKDILVHFRKKKNQTRATLSQKNSPIPSQHFPQTIHPHH